MGRVVDDLVRLVQAGLTRETLPEPPPEPPPAGRRPSVLRTLLGRETLPEAPPAAPRPRVSLLRLLLAREALPLEPTRTRTRRHWIAQLFAPERLDPPGPAGPEVR
jgi:hypothetical protein